MIMNRKARGAQLPMWAGVAMAALLAGTTQTAVSAVPVVIDLFSTQQVAADVVDGGSGDSQSTATGLADILGGQRDINANALSGAKDYIGDGVCQSGELCSVMSISNGSASFSNDVLVFAEGTLQWDGPDQNIALVPDGLGGVDLTAGGTANGFVFSVLFSDHDWYFTIEAHTDATHFTKFLLKATAHNQDTAPETGYPDPLPRFIPFAPFETPGLCGFVNPDPDADGDFKGVVSVECGSAGVVDLSHLGALQIRLNTGVPSLGAIGPIGPQEALDVTITAIIAPTEDGDGRIAPTGTTCEDFVNRRETTSDGLPVNLPSFDMQVKNGEIFNVSNPGAAFYFTRFLADGDTTVDIVQTSDAGEAYEMPLLGWQLFAIVDEGDTGLVCSLMQQGDLPNEYSSGPEDGDATIPLGTLPEGEYAMRIRMDPKALKGLNDPLDDVHNDFATEIGGSQVDHDPDGVLLERIEK